MDNHNAQQQQQQVREQATASSSPPRPPPKSAVPTSTRRNPILRAALDPLSSLAASTTPPDAFAVSETALDLLLIEMVTVTVRTARRRRLRERRVLQRLMAAAAVVGGNADGSDADDLSSDCDDDDDDRGGSGGAGDGNEEVVDAGALMDAFMLQATVSGTSSGGVGQAPVPSPLFGPNGNVANGTTVDREAVFHKLESMGYAVGQRLMERYARDRPRFAEGNHLDIVKFVCKELWMQVWRKPADNLKTNHRGMFVIQDNAFRWFSRMSGAPGASSAEVAHRIAPFTHFPCGLVKGALAAAGMTTTVVAEVSTLPQCTFKIELVQSTAGSTGSATPATTLRGR